MWFYLKLQCPVDRLCMDQQVHVSKEKISLSAYCFGRNIACILLLSLFCQFYYSPYTLGIILILCIFNYYFLDASYLVKVVGRFDLYEAAC